MNHNIVIIIQHAPYQSDNKAYDALRFAGAALAEDMAVNVHLLDVGVFLAQQQRSIPENKPDLEELLQELIECGLVVQACGKSLDDYQINDNEMIHNIERASMKKLATWVKECDLVMTF